MKIAHLSTSLMDVPLKRNKKQLLLLTGMMQNYYKKPVILLIDEYDVPVEKRIIMDIMQKCSTP